MILNTALHRHLLCVAMRLAIFLIACHIACGLVRAADNPPVPVEAEETAVRLMAQVDEFPDWVTSVAISPDGETIAAGSFETVKLLLATGELKVEWQAGKGFVRALAFLPDGQSLFVGGYKGISIWTMSADDKDPQSVGQLTGHRGYVEDLKFSPDGKQLISCGEDGTVRLWDVEHRTELAQHAGDKTPINGIAYSPDGKQLAVAAGDVTRLSQKGRVFLLDALALEHIRDLPEHERAATSVCFTSDGRFLLSGSFDERVHVVDPRTGEAHGFFGAHSRPVNCLAVIANDRIAISGSGGRFPEKNEVKFWDPEEGTEWASIEAHSGKVNDLAVSHDGRLLVTGSQDKSLAILDLSGLLKVTGK